MSDGLDKDKIRRDFADAVNMAPKELEEWLQTPESRKVGQKKDGADHSVGWQSGQNIVKIKRKTKAELTDEDYRHMRKVVGFVHRHLAQEPANPVTSPWRYSLMNWGHDLLK